MLLLAALTFVPLVGRIFGIRINVDAMVDLERRLGRGMPAMGGHSHGARVWRDARRGWTVYADGFEYEPGARYPAQYVETIRLSRGAEWPGKVPSVPRAAVYGAFARLRPGMGRTQIRAALKGLAGTWTGDTFAQTGGATIRHTTNGETERFTRWRAEFTFVKGRLDAIDLSAGLGGAALDRPQRGQRPVDATTRGSWRQRACFTFARKMEEFSPPYSA